MKNNLAPIILIVLLFNFLACANNQDDNLNESGEEIVSEEPQTEDIEITIDGETFPVESIYTEEDNHMPGLFVTVVEFDKKDKPCVVEVKYNLATGTYLCCPSESDTTAMVGVINYFEDVDSDPSYIFITTYSSDECEGEIQVEMNDDQSWNLKFFGVASDRTYYSDETAASTDTRKIEGHFENLTIK